jgi:hypothetical protein
MDKLGRSHKKLAERQNVIQHDFDSKMASEIRHANTV